MTASAWMGSATPRQAPQILTESVYFGTIPVPKCESSKAIENQPWDVVRFGKPVCRRLESQKGGRAMKHRFCTGFILVLSLLIAACAQGGPTAGNIPASLSDVTDADRQLYERLVETEPQPADAVALAIAIEGLDPSSIPKDRTEPERVLEVGDVETFWVHNSDTLEFNEIEAELVIISPHAYFWQDVDSAAVNADREPATAADWQVAADTFEASYTSVRDVFGTEESPGIDGDERVYIVHSDRLGRAGGYFGDVHKPYPGTGDF